jgi:hypothetical protein
MFLNVIRHAIFYDLQRTQYNSFISQSWSLTCEAL